MKILITYTYSPGPKAQQAEERLGLLAEMERDRESLAGQIARLEMARGEDGPAGKAGEGETLAQMQAQIDEIDQIIQAERPDLLAAAQERRRIRFEVRSCSYLDRGHYWALIEEGRAWLAERGIDPANPADGEAQLLANLIYFRAEMLASVGRERTPGGYAYKAEIQAGTGEPWARGQIPTDWTSLDGMAEVLPGPLFNEWRNAAQELNAGVLPTIGNFTNGSPVVATRIA